MSTAGFKTEFEAQSVTDGTDPVKELLRDGRRLEFERRVEMLQFGTSANRRRAAVALVEFGQAAVGPLCEALGQRDDRVKAAAARALADIGDPAAIRPLMASLKKSLAGGSGRRHAFLISAPMIFALLALAMWLVLQLTVKLEAAAWLMVVCWLLKWIAEAVASTVNHSEFHGAVAAALADLAEYEASPELREVLPDMQALAKGVQKVPTARKALADAATRIDRLTAEFRSLPIAAEPAELSADQLPRVKVETQLIPSSLPQPAESDGT